MCSAALQFARRGWPVFPCRERDGEPYFVKHPRTGEPVEKTPRAKQPYIATGLKAATTDETRIRAWWREHPDALIGLPTGANGCFVLDFDPRTDEESGEVYTLERLKADLEDMMGCPLPRSVTAVTQSDGVHVYFRQPDGEPIRNRGNLPEHVDVRGQGGYVIAPPSVMVETGARYRWLDRGDWRDDDAIAEAPAALVEILRTRKTKHAPAAPAAPAGPSSRKPAQVLADVDDDLKRYGMRALEGECRSIRQAPSGKRNDQLNISSLKVASLVAAGVLDERFARMTVEAAARDNAGDDDEAQLLATIASGWTAGLASPRDLAEIAAASRSRRERGPSRPPPRSAPPAAAAVETESFRSGSLEGLASLKVGEAARLVDVSREWLARRLLHGAAEADAIRRLAFSIGRRIAAGLVDEGAAKEALWEKYELVAGISHDDIDRAIDDGFNRGFDIAPLLLTMKCVGYPMTDFGIGERFRDRFGQDFRFTTAKGWLGWDGRRWKVLDQDEKTPPAEVIAAVFETVRMIQDEARFMADTGVRMHTEDEEFQLDQPHPHGLDRFIAKGKQLVKLSSIMAKWGRDSETVGKPAAIARLAQRWLTVPIEAFDHDHYAFNVMNGTLRFRIETGPDGAREASVTLSDHCRDDMQTKLSPVEYDPAATSPLYDGMFAWAQPDAAMRRYLHQIGGYSLTGDAGEQKLWFWYGRGRNGKGTTLDVWQHVSGEYSDNIPIGSFLDQGIKKRGDQASPDLAKLGGVRMLRSSEPGRNEKLDSGLIKLVTGGDPLPVRMLHRGFFNLKPLFKLIIMGNSRFDIPDTDDGIWSRMKLVPWLRNIEKPEPGVANWPEKDPKLPSKIIQQEAAGVLNHLIRGLLDHMVNGLVEPRSVTEATDAYRDASDPIARFMRMCTVPEDGSRIQSSKLHEVFVAWAKAAGEREWSNKGFSNAMTEKGYEKKASDGMWWLNLKLVREVHDFVDQDGKPRALPDEADPIAGRPPPDPGDPFGDLPP